ncbi:MAG TPA: DUF4249 domain-containing protein [Salinivirgaceae bacterium]|nr:DUF4249 domain-containing protein [Salinivirgaceae bacterium]HQA75573.1 DUF4249 domain-containing protein [Salinivirgaceae bacterium]
MKNFLLIAVIVFLFACERETKVDIPESEPKIVVSCLLIPKKNIEIYICQSIYIYDTKEIPITNATVDLYKENVMIETIPHAENGFYRSDLQPEIGKSYSVEINVQGFKTIKAQTSVPIPVTIDSIKTTRNVGTSVNGRKLSYYQMFISSAGANNDISYYKYIFEVLTDSLDGYGQLNFNKAFSYDAVIMNEGDIYNRFFSTQLYNTSTFNLNLYFEDPADLFFDIDTVRFTISSQMYSLSQELYLYEKSLKKYTENQNNIFEQNNPPLIYSNIENGYGIFAGLSFSNVISERVVIATK